MTAVTSHALPAVDRSWNAFQRHLLHRVAAVVIPLFAASAITCSPFTSYSADPAGPPNIVLVLADDLGYGDLACFGSKEVRTPNLDQFAKEGLRLTSCYAGHANCSPSRTALMTGRTPTRVGVRNWIPHGSPVHVRKEEITIATLLKKAGYSTCHVGKWHMTGQFNEPGVPQPGEHGFDHWMSTQNNALPSHKNPDNFVRNGKAVGQAIGYSAHVIVDEAIGWLRAKRDKAKPFFLYVCFHEPHEPIASDPNYARLYPHDDPAYSAHHGNITQMDDAFGRLIRTLREQNLNGNTLVYFTSDNGPAITNQHPYGSAGPLRDKKGFLTEGGIRVPGILRWPGKIKPATESDEPVCGVDFLPTVCAIVGIEPPKDRTLDGTSIVPVFSGKKIARREPLYWHFNRAAGNYQVALRDGDWKILATLDQRPMARTNDVTEEEERQFKAAEPVSFVLYNLKDDIGETKDLAAAEPERLAELKGQLVKKYHEVRDESPTWPAWTFDNREGKRIVQPEYVKNRAKGKKGAK
jgi:arylsulfatase A